MIERQAALERRLGLGEASAAGSPAVQTGEARRARERHDARGVRRPLDRGSRRDPRAAGVAPSVAARRRHRGRVGAHDGDRRGTQTASVKGCSPGCEACPLMATLAATAASGRSVSGDAKARLPHLDQSDSVVECWASISVRIPVACRFIDEPVPGGRGGGAPSDLALLGFAYC
jgi:hypothetical protein